MNIFILITMNFCVLIFVITTIRIYHFLKERGEDVNFLLLRLKMISYAERYKQITRSETGKTGPLFYHWIISINMALLLFILLAFMQ